MTKRKHGWIIDREYDFGENMEGAPFHVAGPSNMTASEEEIRARGKRFRLFDDDGNLYYSGFVLGDEFAPLDNFGAPDSGCTEIQIEDERGSGVFKTL